MLTKFRFLPKLFNQKPFYAFGAPSGPVDYNKIVLRDEKSGFFIDPNSCSRKIIKLISLYDGVQNIDKITLNSTWEDIGIDKFAYVEIMLEVEKEFNLELSDDHLEGFKTVWDITNHISRSFFSMDYYEPTPEEEEHQ